MHDEDSGCPICRASAWMMWIDEQSCALVECESCTAFTITTERIAAFHRAWLTGDRETLMALEHLSRYLRLAGDDRDREVTDASWLSLAIEGEQMDDD